jgi:hypothetical protein
MPGPSRVYSMWLPVDLVEHVDDTARTAGLSRNAFVRSALESASGFGAVADPLGDHGAHGVVVQ